jgi:hypothetical protein
MYVEVKNENYGFAVATHGRYVAAGNPNNIRYTALSASFRRTGSVDVFRYDANTDTHLYVETLYKPLALEELLLAAETSSFIKTNVLKTEPSGYDIINKNKDLRVDESEYIHFLEDDYGHAVDWYDQKLAVGCRYYWNQIIVGAHTFDTSGSCVDVWDYTNSERTIYTHNDPVPIEGFGFVTGTHITASSGNTSSLDFSNYDTASMNFFYVKFNVPAGYDQIAIYGSVLGVTYSVISRVVVSPNGQYVTFAFDSGLPSLFLNAVGIISNEITHFHIENPDTSVTTSFGQSVALNEDWLAIGSPQVSGSKGMVYLYKNDCTGSNLSWSLYQKLEPSSLVAGQRFGWDLSLNKSATFSCPNRLVIGCGAANNNNVYLYELSASLWVETYQFHQDTSSLYPLTFDTASYPILLSASYQTSSFGWAVSMWEDTVVIGAPTERHIFEYAGSTAYEQGTAYIFERCFDTCQVTASSYRLIKKVYGDKYTLKNNRLGYSVSVYDDNMVIGIPKRNVTTMTTCFEQGSIPQQLYCNADLEDLVHGQWAYLTYNTSSSDWDLQKVFQKKKRFMSPYRSLAEDVSVGDMSIVIGAPMILLDNSRNITIAATESLDIALDDIMGKVYIYNLWNFKDRFYVGNVFYRNGTLVINTSGSAFEGLFFNPTTPYTYEYLLNYQSRHTIHEKQVVCTVDPGEFNVSTNPTAVVKATSSFDVNKNGTFDFQDADVLLRYMQYKNTLNSGTYSFDWSSSIVMNQDEISFYHHNASLWTNTDSLFSSSLKRFENVDTWFEDLLDFNQDNKIDVNDMLIMWKYFSHRLTERNYLSYINTNCLRQQVSQAMIYLDNLSKRDAVPMIAQAFSNYDQQTAADQTGSFLSPMVTTIGLYDGLDLVAVAKVGSPVKLPKTLPINFVVKMDF